MPNYKYVGCVTGCSESGDTQLIAPTETQYPVERAANPYTERLLGVKLLLPLDSDSGGGNGGETGVCEPTYTSLLIDPVQPTFGSVVTARYRVNGGAWNDYSMGYEDGYDPLFQFFEHLSDASMPHQIVEPSGSGRHAAFRAHPYNWAIWGAERTEPYSYNQESVVTAESTTIDFVVFDQGSYDLIANYFGEDTTIKSCALAKWMGE